MRIALATGASCASDIERLGLGVFLVSDPDPRVSKTAKRMMGSWKAARILRALAVDFHSDVLEYIVEFLSSTPKLHQMLFYCQNLSERALSMIAQETDAETCERLSGMEKLLLRFPKVYWDLKSNPNCSGYCSEHVKRILESKGAFMSSSFSEELDLGMDDLEAEILASLNGGLSPTLQRNQDITALDDIDSIVSSALESVPDSLSDLKGANVSFDLSSLSDVEEELNEDEDLSEEELGEHLSWEQKLKDMPVGHRIKMAYRGNKQVRSILIRDTNKSVAVAVVRSGRLSDGEIAQYAGNRNLVDDVIREISSNAEFLRKYPVKLALLQNPKTPIKKALSLIPSLHKKDLQQLCRNKNVPTPVRRRAAKFFSEKYGGGSRR
jgi:hypothetical protein